MLYFIQYLIKMKQKHTMGYCSSTAQYQALSISTEKNSLIKYNCPKIPVLQSMIFFDNHIR